MFGMGMPEIMLILAVALIVIGPKKLPGLAKTIGRAMGEFKSATRDFKRSIDLDGDLQDVKDSLNSVNDIPTYDPDLAAYKTADKTPPDGGDAAPAEENRPPSETDDADQPAADPEADPPKTPGAESHG